MGQRLQAAREAKETSIAAIYAAEGSEFDMESLLAEAPHADMSQARVYVRPAPPAPADDDDELKPVMHEAGRGQAGESEDKAEESIKAPAPGRVASSTSQGSSGSKADVKIQLGVFK